MLSGGVNGGYAVPVGKWVPVEKWDLAEKVV